MRCTQLPHEDLSKAPTGIVSEFVFPKNVTHNFRGAGAFLCEHVGTLSCLLLLQVIGE